MTPEVTAGVMMLLAGAHLLGAMLARRAGNRVAEQSGTLVGLAQLPAIVLFINRSTDLDRSSEFITCVLFFAAMMLGMWWWRWDDDRATMVKSISLSED